jgi:peptide-methionine (S)-S-oxide reductase
MAKAYFAAGCFWGVESAFRRVKGVQSTAVGYMGGRTEHPTYQEVCSDRTGHAETVEVDYDPQQVSYEKLLELFWNSHDPTQVNRQGPDVGTQYRSAIVTTSNEQADTAKTAKDKLVREGRFRRPIATQVQPAPAFWKAEDYHQQYFEKRGVRSSGH